MTRLNGGELLINLVPYQMVINGTPQPIPHDEWESIKKVANLKEGGIFGGLSKPIIIKFIDENGYEEIITMNIISDDHAQIIGGCINSTDSNTLLIDASGTISFVYNLLATQ